LKRVTGIGGVFFKTVDTKGLTAWYGRHLGIVPRSDGGIAFEWRDLDDAENVGYTVLGLFESDTTYFAPSAKPFMLNFRVADLDGLLAQLRAEGVDVDEKVEEYEYGRFGWITDPEGNRIELWEPAPERRPPE
jgi:predicted enzyme related to lactoylglutathione lyase